jgi:hypothetical protein
LNAVGTKITSSKGLLYGVLVVKKANNENVHFNVSIVLEITHC